MDSNLRSLVRERANKICEYCLVPEAYDQLPFQTDHIIAEKHGGLTEPDNLAWSCYDCNIYKGPNIAGIDPDTGIVVQLFHPRQHQWSEHFQWREAELQGLTPIGKATIAVLRINLERRIAFRRELSDEGLMILK
ncbi:MAG: HNH endonuclease signature motif containing protein [Bythopirellula sp.]|nr:HNH endonuclease signature motif containing protein [Bythopirellula sp.]